MKKNPSVIYYANRDDDGTGFTTLEEIREGHELWEKALDCLEKDGFPFFKSRRKAMAKCKSYLRSQIANLRDNLKNL